MPGRSILSPFGERVRAGRDDAQLVSRGVVVESGPQLRARQALRAAERLARAVVDGLEEGVIVTDAELRPVSWNASALRILGVSAEQLAAEGLIGGSAGALRYGDGKPVTTGDNPPSRALRQGAPVRATLRRTPPQGSERWITLLARPIGGAHGTSRQGVVCTFADVTSTRRGRAPAARGARPRAALPGGRLDARGRARLAGPRRADQPPGLRAARLRGARAARPRLARGRRPDRGPPRRAPRVPAARLRRRAARRDAGDVRADEDRRDAQDRLAQRGAARRRGHDHRGAALRRGRHRAPRGGGAGRPSSPTTTASPACRTARCWRSSSRRDLARARRTVRPSRSCTSTSTTSSSSTTRSATPPATRCCARPRCASPS